MSVMARVLNVWLSLTEKPAIRRFKDPVKFRNALSRRARLMFRGPKLPVQEIQIAGVPCLLVGAEPRPDAPVILYLHGGGFVLGSPLMYQALCAILARDTGLQVVIPDYRLAPEHRFPAAFEDCLAVYSHLQATRNVVIGGDSAGGALTLSILAATLREGLVKPLGSFCFSPLTNAQDKEAGFAEIAKSDVALPWPKVRDMLVSYLGDHDPADPRVSPFFADFTGAPPVWGCVGTTEMLAGDYSKMIAKLEAEGVDVTSHVEEDLPHVWPLFHNVLPEAKQTLRQVSQWIKGLPGYEGGS